MDLPRKPSPWSLGGDTTSSIPSEDLKGPRNVTPRPLVPGAASRQRPASTGPWSPPTPPTLTVQSPVSPPKPIPFNQAPVNTRIPHAADTPRSNSPTPPKLPNSLPSHPNSRLLFEPADFSAPRQSQSTRTSPIPTKRAPPPPINRASKPATPTTLVFNLDSGRDRSKDKVSPFSTPPSSDESLEKEKTSQINTENGKGFGQSSYFHPPPVHHAVEARREAAAEQNSRETAHALKPRVASKSAQDSSDLPHQRPTLPSRPGIQASPPRQQRANLEHVEPPRLPIESKPPPRPSDASKLGKTPAEFLPPPRRNLIPSGSIEKPVAEKNSLMRSITEPEAPPTRNLNPQKMRIESSTDIDVSRSTMNTSPGDYPDASQINRRPPKSMCGVHRLWTEYDTKLFDLSGSHVCSGGYITRAWDTRNSRLITDFAPPEREIKVTALVFKPGKNTEEEGLCVWLGNNVGEIQEVDLRSQQVLETKPNAHNRREIIRMYRHQNSIWSLDEEGKLHVWTESNKGTPSLRLVPLAFRVARGHSFSIVIKNLLWLAIGKDIRIYNPSGGDPGFNVTLQALSQTTAGEITSGAVISNQLDKVYFGHSDGKVTIYSTKDFICLGIVNVSAYKINCLVGAGVYLWAGYNTGMIYVYDTQQRPWKVVKEWQAHTQPVLSLVVDRSSLWKFGHLQLASLGADNAICFWDGMLEDDWIGKYKSDLKKIGSSLLTVIENDMQQHDVDYCTFDEIKTVVMTWNAGASTPSTLRHQEKGIDLFREIIQVQSPPDILVFGFQELVDLEDKKLTAKSLFKGSKKKDSGEADHMSHQYRAWRDFLVQLLDDNMPASETYYLLHTASMVGLFTCIFVRAPLRPRVRNLGAAEVKRGLGGLHGNKGSIMVRFILDNSSLCFINCHLAAGQSQTINRNNDITAILESAVLPNEPKSDARVDSFSGGGDGSMIMDHEICVLNGDLNYRIDTMGKDTVVKAINADNFSKLLDRDQLLVSRRRNPGFRLRSFQEQSITFAPTYKYDVGTDRYDTSEKNRSPAWCDRLLYRGAGRIKQVNYRRHELRLSDHRPVSGTFLMRIKSINQKQRAAAWEQCENRLQVMRQNLARAIK